MLAIEVADWIEEAPFPMPAGAVGLEESGLAGVVPLALVNVTGVDIRSPKFIEKLYLNK